MATLDRNWNVPSFQQFGSSGVWSWLPSRSLVLSWNHHHHPPPTETGRALSWGSAGSTTGPASPLGRCHAWQFRNAQGWAGRACMCQKRNEEQLSFGSDPIITTWYRFQGKAAVMCMGEHTRVFTPHVWVYLSIHGFAGQWTQISSHYSKWGAQVARKDSKGWTKKNHLSGNVRGTMAEISRNQPRAPLLYSCGLRRPGHKLMGLRIGSLSNKVKEKKHLRQPHSFGHYKATENI